jgi:hypothetical protein
MSGFFPHGNIQIQLVPAQIHETKFKLHFFDLLPGLPPAVFHLANEKRLSLKKILDYNLIQ